MALRISGGSSCQSSFGVEVPSVCDGWEFLVVSVMETCEGEHDGRVIESCFVDLNVSVK